MPRNSMIQKIGQAVSAIDAPHPVRVGVDGVGAAGKTTLADELAEYLRAEGRYVIRATIDGFHRPRKQRIRRGKDSVEGYYHDSFNHEAVRQEILEPLGPAGNKIYRKAVFDFRIDSPVDEPLRTAPADAVLVFDGMFLFRPELNDCWDYRIFAHSDFEVTLARACKRDLELFGSVEEIHRRYHARYIPGQKLYLETVQPQKHAHVAIDNNQPDRPVVHWSPRGA